MTKTIDGGPAFPMSTVDGYTQEGRNLRDYFAAQALPAVVHACKHDAKHGMTAADYFAGRAYEIADAMLKAREV